MNRLALMLGLGLIGCATTGGGWHYEKDGASKADYNMDTGQCRAQAFAVSNPTLLQIGIIMDGCMQGKGWVRVADR